MLLVKIDGKCYVVIGIGDDDRNADVASYDVEVDSYVLVGGRSKKTTVRHGKKLYSFVLLIAYFIEEYLGVIHQFRMSLYRFRPHAHLPLLLKSKLLDEIVGIIHR
jgi:hypothetical protein